MKRVYAILLIVGVFVLSSCIQIAPSEPPFSVDELLEQGTVLIYEDFASDELGAEPSGWNYSGSSANPFVVVHNPTIAEDKVLRASMLINETEVDKHIVNKNQISLTEYERIAVDFEFYFTPLQEYDAEIRNKLSYQMNFNLGKQQWPPVVTAVISQSGISNIQPPNNFGLYVYRNVTPGQWNRVTILIDCQNDSVEYVVNGELMEEVGLLRSDPTEATYGTIGFYWKSNTVDWYLRYVKVVGLE